MQWKVYFEQRWAEGKHALPYPEFPWGFGLSHRLKFPEIC